MGIYIRSGSYDWLKADAIVNGTNTNETMEAVRRIFIADTGGEKGGTLTAHAYRQAAGWDAVLPRWRFQVARKIAELEQRFSFFPAGQARISPVGGLPGFRCQITTAVPEWQGGEKGETAILRLCYENCLRLAAEHGCRSILIPQLGNSGKAFPPEISFRTAWETLPELARQYRDMDILFLSLDDEALVQRLADPQNKIIAGALRFFSENYRPSEVKFSCRGSMGPYLPDEFELAVEKVRKLLPEKKSGEMFWKYLQGLIERSGKSKVEIYRGANLDRRIFSKIQNATDYIPSKRTILSLAISLRLSLEETKALLAQGGYALSPALRMDIIVGYFISQGNYDIYLINELLYCFMVQPLGSGSDD